jgi:hypothetical protein
MNAAVAEQMWTSVALAPASQFGRPVSTKLERLAWIMRLRRRYDEAASDGCLVPAAEENGGMLGFL